MARAAQRLSIRVKRHKDKDKKRKIAIHKKSGGTVVVRDKDIITVKRYNYKNELIESKTYKLGDENK